MNRFENNFTQMVFSRNLTNPRVGSKKIPKIIFTHIANDHPTGLVPLNKLTYALELTT